MDYFPFVKAKMNETSGIRDLSGEALSMITPFFDIPRPKKDTEKETKKAIEVSKRHIDRYFPEDKPFFLDIFDLNPLISIGGAHLYDWALSHFSSPALIPVVGLDRDPGHAKSVVDYFLNNSGVHSKGICIRLLQSDFEDLELIEDDLNDLISKFSEYIDYYDIALDCRIIGNGDIPRLSSDITQFLDDLFADFKPRNTFVSSSSISPVASDYVRPSSQAHVARFEKQLWESVKRKVPESYRGRFFYGDYGIVSPNYSDPDLKPELFNSVSTPKALYTYDYGYFAVRGGSFKSHPRGRYQYHDLASIIASQPFFRGAAASTGDRYIAESSLGLTGKGSAGTWIKNTLISHIELVKDEVNSGTLTL